MYKIRGKFYKLDKIMKAVPKKKKKEILVVLGD